MEIFITFFFNNIIYMIIAGIMYLCDTISGFAKVFYKKNYQSEKARKSFSKLLVFVCVIFAFLGIDIMIHYAFPETKINLCPVICVAISIVELTSIGENLEEVTGTNYITDILKYTINLLKSLVNKIIGKEVNSND